MSIPKISTETVTNLIKNQFPEWAHLPIKSVDLDGWDNRTFRLGTTMSIRLPSSEAYASQVLKEQTWLPKLASHLSFAIPKPLAMGSPSNDYPWNWSIYQWIEGQSANSLSFDQKSLNGLACQLAQFLNELHKIDTRDAPLGGLHNFYRGNHLSVYDQETRFFLSQLQNIIDPDLLMPIWQKAIAIRWTHPSVWVHGDFSAGNILIQDKQLTAIIDFGCMAIGDPACDLVIAWTFLDDESREIFKSHLPLDSDTWARARGWALWKSLLTIAGLKDNNSQEIAKQRQLINCLLEEHHSELD